MDGQHSRDRIDIPARGRGRAANGERVLGRAADHLRRAPHGSAADVECRRLRVTAHDEDAVVGSTIGELACRGPGDVPGGQAGEASGGKNRSLFRGSAGVADHQTVGTAAGLDQQTGENASQAARVGRSVGADVECAAGTRRAHRERRADRHGTDVEHVASVVGIDRNLRGDQLAEDVECRRRIRDERLAGVVIALDRDRRARFDHAAERGVEISAYTQQDGAFCVDRRTTQEPHRLGVGGGLDDGQPYVSVTRGDPADVESAGLFGNPDRLLGIDREQAARARGCRVDHEIGTHPADTAERGSQRDRLADDPRQPVVQDIENRAGRGGDRHVARRGDRRDRDIAGRIEFDTTAGAVDGRAVGHRDRTGIGLERNQWRTGLAVDAGDRRKRDERAGVEGDAPAAAADGGIEYEPFASGHEDLRATGIDGLVERERAGQREMQFPGSLQARKVAGDSAHRHVAIVFDPHVGEGSRLEPLERGLEPVGFTADAIEGPQDGAVRGDVDQAVGLWRDVFVATVEDRSIGKEAEQPPRHGDPPNPGGAADVEDHVAVLRVDEREIECVGTPQEDPAETGHRLGGCGIDVDEGGRGADR